MTEQLMGDCWVLLLLASSLVKQRTVIASEAKQSVELVQYPIRSDYFFTRIELICLILFTFE
jgi:hypothetical protein